MRTADEYAAAARENFLAGYNCAQSVLLAFAGEIGETPERALRLASPLGAGMGRLRQVCGALSAAFLVEGALRGYTDPADAEPRRPSMPACRTWPAALRARWAASSAGISWGRGPRPRPSRRREPPPITRSGRA